MLCWLVTYVAIVTLGRFLRAICMCRADFISSATEQGFNILWERHSSVVFFFRCERVVRETVGKLREAGHDLVSFHIPHPSRAASLFYKNLLPDRGEYTLQLYSNEVISAYLQRFVTILKVFVYVAHSFFLSYDLLRKAELWVVCMNQMELWTVCTLLHYFKLYCSSFWDIALKALKISFACGKFSLTYRLSARRLK